MATKTKGKPKKTATEAKVLNVAFVWDMSGSMTSVFEATRDGTSKYLNDLVEDEQRLNKKFGHENGPFTYLSVTAFDTLFEPWVVNQPISEIKIEPLIQRYQPRGMTALYDAIGNTIAELSGALAKRRAGDEKCLVVIMTDGEENSSQEYGGPEGRKKLFNLIKRYEATGKWTFVYLGANVDAYAESANIGIAAGNTAYYASTHASVATASAGVSNVTQTLRSNTRGHTQTAFSDAGESQDYREENS